MFKKVIALWLVVLLISVSIAAHAEEKSLKREVSERFIVQIDSSSSVGESFKVSPDGKRLAYAAIVGDKSFVVVDGKEEKKYDFIGGGLIFSPDSKRVAYGAKEGDKWFVVVDGKDEYDGIVTIGGGRIIFDSPNSLHYLAMQGSSIYLVEERIR